MGYFNPDYLDYYLGYFVLVAQLRGQLFRHLPVHLPFPLTLVNSIHQLANLQTRQLASSKFACIW